MTGAEDASSEKEGVVADGQIRPRRVAAEEFVQDGECLLYSPSRDEASALNGTATEVWLLCDGRLTLSGIARGARRALRRGRGDAARRCDAGAGRASCAGPDRVAAGLTAVLT